MKNAKWLREELAKRKQDRINYRALNLAEEANKVLVEGLDHLAWAYALRTNEEPEILDRAVEILQNDLGISARWWKNSESADPEDLELAEMHEYTLFVDFMADELGEVEDAADIMRNNIEELLPSIEDLRA